MMPHNMQPNMAQAGTILPFPPTLYPTGIGFNQFFNNFQTSQSNMPSSLHSQVWRGQSGTQIWAAGQSSFLGQGCGGGQSSNHQSQG
ncbi:hypothetical protein RHGRI_029312 [Rhododendron griersonianum]|uniref:Uncharacterized protein n=1 Tax=Rhododendron griersonianum TaxID=479676 RepID=A0AAV6IIW1_9ERIC|nr:hypothetical protein RHGRI_029312 [Rhododendron griersonianum]